MVFFSGRVFGRNGGFRFLFEGCLVVGWGIVGLELVVGGRILGRGEWFFKRNI